MKEINDEFWINHRIHKDYLMDVDKPWASYDEEVSFIIKALMGMI